MCSGAAPTALAATMMPRMFLYRHGLAAGDINARYGVDHGFSCGVSLEVQCHGQEEIDLLWEGLSAVPEAEQCGWLVDRQDFIHVRAEQIAADDLVVARQVQYRQHTEPVIDESRYRRDFIRGVRHLPADHLTRGVVAVPNPLHKLRTGVELLDF